jgi:hypothetical protein
VKAYEKTQKKQNRDHQKEAFHTHQSLLPA